MKPKTFLRRFFSGLLASSLLIGATFTGCSTSESENTSTSSPGEEKAYELSDPNTFPILKSGTAELTVFVAPPSQSPDFDNNEFTEYYEDYTGVHINWIYTTEQDKAQKLTLLLSSGDTLPDIIGVPSWTTSQTLQYGQSGLIVPIGDAIEKQGYNIKRLFELYPTYESDLTLSDGNIYCTGMPANTYHTQVASKMWVYKPWLDALNLEVPKTIDEFYDMLKAFKEQDPNGNGMADEIPLAGSLQSWNADPLKWVMNSFTYYGESQKYLQVNDGKVEASFTTPEYREGIEFLAKLYEEGLLSGETYTQDEDQMRAMASNADIQILGCVPAGVQLCFQTIDDKHTDWKNWIGIAPVEGPDGVQFAEYYPTDLLGGCAGVVTKDCKDVELAVKWMDGCFTGEMANSMIIGPKGKYWDYVDEGVTFDGKPAVWDYLGNYLDPEKKNYDWSQAMPSGSEPDWANGQRIEDPESDWGSVLNNVSTEYYKYQPPTEMILPLNLIFENDEAKEVSDLETTIQTYVSEMQARFITGDANVATEWDKYLEELNNMQLERYLELYQKSYDKKIASST